MQQRMSFWKGVGVLAAVVVLAGTAPASAQTQGMERRNQRRDNRAAARAAKQACKAGDEKSRAECRQVKREARQAGRNDGESNASAAPALKQAELWLEPGQAFDWDVASPFGSRQARAQACTAR